MNQARKEMQVSYIVFEYQESTELFDFVYLEGFSEHVSRYIFRQLLIALRAIHQKGFAHRDLKLETILIDSNNQIKLADLCQTTSYTRSEEQTQ